jgi:nucleotide-binding universal stress UspA family protein
MPFNWILGSVDLSPLSASLVEHALAVAEAPGARVHVLHAVEPLLLQAATIAGEEAALRSGIDEAMQRLVGEVLRRADHAPTVETSIAEGAPEIAILEAAQRGPCDLIVMGLHGMSRYPGRDGTPQSGTAARASRVDRMARVERRRTSHPRRARNHADPAPDESPVAH